MIDAFEKARGLTASEKVLADLCGKSFLSLWSYPNLYRKSGKELTDLLVVFGDDVIPFADKSCAFRMVVTRISTGNAGFGAPSSNPPRRSRKPRNGLNVNRPVSSPVPRRHSLFLCR